MGTRGFKPNPHRIPQFQLPFRPVVLKELALACDISQQELVDAVSAIVGRKVSRATANLTINRGYVPITIAGYRQAVETVIGSHGPAVRWLAERGLGVANIWNASADALKKQMPAGQRRRISAGLKQFTEDVIRPGDPSAINEEVKQMLKLAIPEPVLKYFKLFRDPFIHDPRSEKEVYRSPDHRYLEYAMYDTATNSGLLAIISEVGAGKSVMRREVVERLRGEEKVRIVYPLITDRSRITAASICDAIVWDLTNPDAKVKVSLEAKSRHVRQLLAERVAQGKRVCMIIEEAHLLTIPALKRLKVFHEMELGRSKLLSIILLGQPELGQLLDEEQYPELRELSRRVQVATIPGLGDDAWDYLALKFSLVGGKIEHVITPEAVKRLVNRLSVEDDARRMVSHAYPLTINNYMAKAMIYAREMGEEMITIDVIDAI